MRASCNVIQSKVFVFVFFFARKASWFPYIRSTWEQVDDALARKKRKRRRSWWCISFSTNWSKSSPQHEYVLTFGTLVRKAKGCSVWNGEGRIFFPLVQATICNAWIFHINIYIYMYVVHICKRTTVSLWLSWSNKHLTATSHLHNNQNACVVRAGSVQTFPGF